MALVLNLKLARLLSRNELVTTAKLNATLRGITIDVAGLVSSSDIAPGAVNAAAMANDAFWFSSAVSTGAVYAASYANPVTSYIDGMWLSFRADHDSKQGAQFDAGAGPKALTKWNGLALARGDIRAGTTVTVRYNSSNTLVFGGCWEVMSLVGNRPVIEEFQGANTRTGGQRGLVPGPKAGPTRLWLRDDGWADITSLIQSIVTAGQTAQSAQAQFLLNNS